MTELHPWPILSTQAYAAYSRYRVKRAYVEARYSTACEISMEDLNAILESVRTLRGIVERVSHERLDQLCGAAKEEQS